MEIIDNNLLNDKINIIIENNSFKYNLKKIEELERSREFCRHDMQHFLDVARLMYIMNLENALNIPKHMIYATALLHDIGRAKQYENGTPHHIASVEIAKDILEQCEYNTKEIDEILDAIGKHGNHNEKLNSLSHVLYVNDKLSRNCSHCTAINGCKWPVEKKNFKIKY